MATTTTDELRSFHAFLTNLLDDPNGQPPPSPEECVDLWRLEHPTPEELAATLDAIREGLADMHAGRTTPAKDVFREIRAMLGQRAKSNP